MIEFVPTKISISARVKVLPDLILTGNKERNTIIYLKDRLSITGDFSLKNIEIETSHIINWYANNVYISTNSQIKTSSTIFFPSFYEFHIYSSPSDNQLSKNAFIIEE